MSARDEMRVLGRLLAGAPFPQELDWGRITRLARRHGVSPMLYWRLRDPTGNAAGGQGTAWTCVQAEVQRILQRDFYAAMARAALAERQLGRALGALAAAAVPALVVKGAAVAAYYPDPAIRNYGDLDVLVPPRLVAQAEAALMQVGYSCTEPKEWAFGHTHQLPPMASGSEPLLVEVHWRLDHPEKIARLSVDEAFARSASWTVCGQPAQRLSAVDAALHLCWHAAVHHRLQMGLRPLVDLAFVTDGWLQSSWEELVTRAEKYGLVRPTCLMLALMERMLGVTVPRQVMEGLHPAGNEPLPEDLGEQLLDLDMGADTPVPVAVVRAGGKSSLRAGLRHFWRHLFMPREGMSVVYGMPADSARIWLTYLWRPLDLVRQYGGSVWGYLWGDAAIRNVWKEQLWLERWLEGEIEQRSGNKR